MDERRFKKLLLLREEIDEIKRYINILKNPNKGIALGDFSSKYPTSPRGERLKSIKCLIGLSDKFVKDSLVILNDELKKKQEQFYLM